MCRDKEASIREAIQKIYMELSYKGHSQVDIDDHVLQDIIFPVMKDYVDIMLKTTTYDTLHIGSVKYFENLFSLLNIDMTYKLETYTHTKEWNNPEGNNFDFYNLIGLNATIRKAMELRWQAIVKHAAKVVIEGTHSENEIHQTFYEDIAEGATDRIKEIIECQFATGINKYVFDFGCGPLGDFRYIFKPALENINKLPGIKYSMDDVYNGLMNSKIESRILKIEEYLNDLAKYPSEISNIVHGVRFNKYIGNISIILKNIRKEFPHKKFECLFMFYVLNDGFGVLDNLYSNEPFEENVEEKNCVVAGWDWSARIYSNYEREAQSYVASWLSDFKATNFEACEKNFQQMISVLSCLNNYYEEIERLDILDKTIRLYDDYRENPMKYFLYILRKHGHSNDNDERERDYATFLKKEFDKKSGLDNSFLNNFYRSIRNDYIFGEIDPPQYDNIFVESDYESDYCWLKRYSVPVQQLASQAEEFYQECWINGELDCGMYKQWIVYENTISYYLGDNDADNDLASPQYLDNVDIEYIQLGNDVDENMPPRKLSGLSFDNVTEVFTDFCKATKCNKDDLKPFKGRQKKCYMRFIDKLQKTALERLKDNYAVDETENLLSSYRV